MSSTEHFIHINARHLRILDRLYNQRRMDLNGGIGWRGLIEGDDDWSMDELFVPLMQRGLIEDLTTVPELGPKAGQYFVRITPLGILCGRLGYMLRDPHKGTVKEVEKYLDELPRPGPKEVPANEVAS